jgi:hypothetical protein
MATALVVTQPFADYAIGDRITDLKAVTDILANHHNRVVRIEVPDPPAPAVAAPVAAAPAPAAPAAAPVPPPAAKNTASGSESS